MSAIAFTRVCGFRHSLPATMKIIPVPVWADNYSYVVVNNEKDRQAFIVDPTVIDAFKPVLAEQQADLKYALVTHHHADHSANSDRVSELSTTAKVVGHDGHRIAGQTLDIADNQVLELGNVKIKALYTPCHTTTHVCYYVVDEETKQQAVFTGDTLFIAGCGRFFEGTAVEMSRSLSRLASLPDDTEVYCGHEYTVTNLRFALSVDPNNRKIAEKLDWAKKRRAMNLFTIPSSIKSEKETNPFMRTEESALKQVTGKEKAVDVMAALRRLKDAFR